MEITVSSRHTEISESLRATTEEKISRLVRYLDGMERAEVHFFEERNPRIADKEICEVTLEGHGHHVRCKVAAPDGYVAVDRAVEKLEHQLHKLKTKLKNRQTGARRNGLNGATPQPRPTVDDEVEGPRIVKMKRFSMKPMTPEEAVLQLDMLGHDFYFFTNADTGRAAVIYRRDDGDLGLIDELG